VVKMSVPSNRILKRPGNRKNFHIHTIFSDGKLSPRQIILWAKRKGRKHISITDHDNFRAWADTEGVVKKRTYGGQTLRELARTPHQGKVKRLRVTTGAEFNCAHNGTKIEILGYHFNELGKGMLALQEKTMGAAEQRAMERIQFLRRKGFVINPQKIDPFNYAWLDAELSRAENKTLLEKLAPDKNNPLLSLRSFLFQGTNSPYAKEAQEAFIDAHNVIDTVRRNGGIAVLAHPLQYFRHLDSAPIEQEKKVEELVQSLKKIGLRGMEVEYSIRADGSYYTKEQMKLLRRVARRNRLKIFGGTDYHHSPRDTI